MWSNRYAKSATVPAAVKPAVEWASSRRQSSSLPSHKSIRRRLHIHIPERTISSWIAEHRKLATYAWLRPDAKKSFAPNEIVRSYTLEHRQVYRFQVHQAKLDMLTRAASSNIRGLENLKSYFDTVGPTYPHHLFTSTVERSSKFLADFRPRMTRKEIMQRSLPLSRCQHRRRTKRGTRPCSGSCSSTTP